MACWSLNQRLMQMGSAIPEGISERVSEFEANQMASGTGCGQVFGQNVHLALLSIGIQIAQSKTGPG
jgi:hypothetical protein